MRIPRKKIKEFVRDIADQCMSSRTSRANRGQLFDSYYGQGSSDPSQPAMFNKLFSSIDDLESLLYSPVSLRFRISDADMPNVVNEAKGRAAAAKIRQSCRQDDSDTLISQAVNKSLVKGLGVTKQLFKRDEFFSSLVEAENFGVLRENHGKLDPDMEGFCHSMLITKHQFARLIANRPDEDELLKKAKRYTRMGTGGLSDTRSSAINIVVGGLYPLQGPGNGVSASRGIVDWMSTPKPDMDPAIEQELLELDEVWVWDDDREDWATFQLIGSDMLIMGRYQIINALAYDPVSRISSPPLKGVHPFTPFCANPVPGYFWGMSEIARLMMLQEAINARITGTNKMLRKQEDPSIKFTGGSGINQIALARFNKPGGYYVEQSPTAKIERDTQQIPQDMWVSLHELERMFDELMGIPPVAKGHGEKGVRSANHAEALVRMFSPRFKDRALLIERNVEDFGALRLDLSRAHIAKKFVAWVPEAAAGAEVGATKEELQFLLPPAKGLVPVYSSFADLPDDVSLTVDSHSASPAFSQDHKSLVFDELKTGMLSPAEAVDELDVSDPTAQQMAIMRRDIAKAEAAEKEQQLKLVSHAGGKK
jgi:hypothetical protein